MIILYQSVLITICIILIIVSLWLLVSYHRAQRALSWWYSKQSGRMRHEGEAIRERILQDLFVFRRHLELSTASSPECQQKLDKYDLETFENIHCSLKKLSEYMYPAYIDDSLPLAIECLLSSYISCISGLSIQLKLLTDWQDKYDERSRVILMVLEELLQITLPLISPSVSILASLEQQGTRRELIVKLTSPTISELASHSGWQQLDFLKHTFKFLTSGKCFYRRENSTQIWYFGWKS